MILILCLKVTILEHILSYYLKTMQLTSYFYKLTHKTRFILNWSKWAQSTSYLKIRLFGSF